MSLNAPKSIHAPPLTAVEMLLRRRPDPARGKGLMADARRAALTGDAGFLRTLLDQGLDARAVADAAKGSTLLMIAAEHGHLSCVLALLPVSSPAQASAQGHTALMMAAAEGRSDCLRALVGASDSRAKDRRQLTALMHAAMGGHVECVEALAPRSDLDALDGDGDSALVWAIESKNAQCVSALLRLGANPRLETRRGSDALFRAVEKNAPELVELLARLCDPVGVDTFGRTPLSIACEKKNWKCADALAAWVEEKDAENAFFMAPENAMPRWAAAREALAIARAAGIESARLGDAGAPSGRPRPGPHRL